MRQGTGTFMDIGGFDLIVKTEEDLGKILDWAQSKFPVDSKWDNLDGTESLWIYLPGHNEWQGIVQVICGEKDWTVVVDVEFAEELKAVLE
jgi:hypothetical protein